MKITLKLKPFSTPNYVSEEEYPPCRGGSCHSLKAVSEESLSELCDQFRKDVFLKAGKKDPKIKN